MPEAVLEADIVYVAGISFFSFQAIAYVADIYREKSKAYSLPEVLAYISFFPTIMSGPIMRPGDFFPQKNLRKEKDGAAADAAVLILSGLFKKVVLSSYLSEHIVKGYSQRRANTRRLPSSLGCMAIPCRYSAIFQATRISPGA